MADSGGTVVVTGGTGFLGGWCIASLLERGYDVRTTVRDLAREHAVRDAVMAAGVDPGSRLTVVSADLSADAGWAQAVAGSRYVLHVASPFPPVQPKDPDELIVPARDGALRVLDAALDAGVERRDDLINCGRALGSAELSDRAVHRGRLDRRRGHLADALRALEDAR